MPKGKSTSREISKTENIILMKNVIKRAISGTIYVAAITGAVLAGGGWLLALLILFGVLATREFLLMAATGTKPHRVCNIIDYIVVASLITTSYAAFNPCCKSASTFLAIAAIAVIVRIIAQLYALGGNAITLLSASMMSYIYVGISLATVPVLYYSAGNPHIVLALLIFIWANDTGAFCVGCTLGKHKLFERISPKKSWEGFFGGLAACILAATIMNLCFPAYYGAPLTLGFMIKLAIIACIFSTFGDLVESLIKRTSGVKDSGNLIPGHGGILDRIDSLLLVMPTSTIYLALIN